MSGSRPNRGGPFGGPIPGAEAWSSSFTGSAQQPHRPDAPAGPGRRRQSPAPDGYSPYAEDPGAFADPYGEQPAHRDEYGEPDQYGQADRYGRQDQYGDAYSRDGGYAPSAYPDQAHPAETYAGSGEAYGDAYARPQRGGDEDYDAFAPHQRPAFDEAPQPGRGRGRRGIPAPEPRPAAQSTRLLDRAVPGADTELDGGPDDDPAGRLPHQGRRRPAEPGFAADARPRGPEDGEPAERRAPGSGGERGGRPRGRTGKAGKAVQGLVLLSLVAAVTAVVGFEKTVNLSVDGDVRQIHTFTSTVSGVLAGDDIQTGAHDLVSPALTDVVADGSTVTVRYGRPVDVTVNGVKHDVWVHYPTVGQALQELGVRVDGARMSVPASAPIGRDGMSFSVYTLRHVTFLVDGKTEPIETTAATVQQAISQAGITMKGQDSASVPLDSVPADNETITILRITGTTEVKEQSIPYPVTKESSASAYVGTTTVLTAGVDGTAEVTYALQTINGVAQPPKEISRVVTKQPVAEVEQVGTKALPSDAADLNWAALAQCESGGNPKSVSSNGMYYGLYQFSVGTWESLGGTGLPSQASPAEQTDLAELLYERSGAGQWPVCGHNLFT